MAATVSGMLEREDAPDAEDLVALRSGLPYASLAARGRWGDAVLPAAGD
jgi:hypothetical protein